MSSPITRRILKWSLVFVALLAVAVAALVFFPPLFLFEPPSLAPGQVLNLETGAAYPSATVSIALDAHGVPHSGVAHGADSRGKRIGHSE